jgi:hypothetical protein
MWDGEGRGMGAVQDRGAGDQGLQVGEDPGLWASDHTLHLLRGLELLD